MPPNIQTRRGNPCRGSQPASPTNIVVLSTTGDTTESENATSSPAGSSISDISSITRLSQRTQVPADPPEEIVDSDDDEEHKKDEPDDGSINGEEDFANICDGAKEEAAQLD